MIYFIARVVIESDHGSSRVIPVDQAGGGSPTGRNYYPIGYTIPGAWSVADDPRSNGKNGDWVPAADALGSMNTPCDPWTQMPDNRRQGIPIIAADGLMQSLGDLGYIYRSNVIPGQPGRWDTLELLQADKGAALLDVMTVRDESSPHRQLRRVCLNTSDPEALRSVFAGVTVGFDGNGFSRAPLQAADVDRIVQALIEKRDRGGRPFVNYADLFNDAHGRALPDGGAIGAAFREAGQVAWQRVNGAGVAENHDTVREGAFQGIVDRVGILNLTNYVSQTGGHLWPYSTPASAARDIQSAIDALQDGGTTLVDYGEYGGGLVVDRPVTVRSLNGAQNTRIEGGWGRGGSCVSLTHSNAVLDGFWVRWGEAGRGGRRLLQRRYKAR